MSDITQGTWNNPLLPTIKLPDFGITEKLQDIYNNLTGNTGYNSSITNPNQRPMGLDYSNVNQQALTTNNGTGSLPTDFKVKTTPTITTTSSSGNGFDMKYYPGWDPAAARADWVATGGSKANTGGSGGTGGGPAPVDKTVSLKGDSRATTVLNDPTASQEFQQSGLNMDEYLSLIDQEAGLSTNFLNEQEAAIRAEQPGLEKNITDQATLLKNQAGTRKEDAQSAARRLYGELQQGYRQRFGGASSAGEAAQALTQNEQQRQMAQNNRTYQEAVSQVDLSANQAVQSAQSEFRNRLLQITQNRTQVESEKLAARRQALQDLSAKVFQIQQQRETFKQNIQLMQEQARLSNTNSINSMSTNPTSNLTMTGNQTTASGNQGLGTAIGSINKTSSGMTKNEDPIANGVYPIMTMTDGRTKYSDGSIR